MGFSLEVSVSAITVFLQGIFSFFSPCVLPLLPLYMGYLAGGTTTTDANGTITYNRKKIIVHTVCFVIGISFAFFLLGVGFSAAGKFLADYQTYFVRFGGILIIIFGLYQLGIFRFGFLSRQRRFTLHLDQLSMNPATALLMGFTFSFAWTPCVGPALTSVLLLVSSSASATNGFLLMALYTLGFILPFLAVGLFTGSLLILFKKHHKVMRYTVKLGGILMVFMGIMMFTGWLNGISGYLANPPSKVQTAQPPATDTNSKDKEQSVTNSPEGEEADIIPAPDFTLTDQYGNSHTLSEYQGKVVFLNFWATWCSPCKEEMPYIEELYAEYGLNEDEVIILSVAQPKTEANPYSQDGDIAHITNFLKENGYTYPSLMDTDGSIFAMYGIRSFPTTFMIDKTGNIFGYISGSLTKDIMKDIISQTQEGVRR